METSKIKIISYTKQLEKREFKLRVLKVGKTLIHAFHCYARLFHTGLHHFYFEDKQGNRGYRRDYDRLPLNDWTLSISKVTDI